MSSHPIRILQEVHAILPREEKEEERERDYSLQNTFIFQVLNSPRHLGFRKVKCDTSLKKKKKQEKSYAFQKAHHLQKENLVALTEGLFLACAVFLGLLGQKKERIRGVHGWRKRRAHVGRAEHAAVQRNGGGDWRHVNPQTRAQRLQAGEDAFFTFLECRVHLSPRDCFHRL